MKPRDFRRAKTAIAEQRAEMHVNRRNVHSHACICYTFLVSINLFAWLLYTFRRPWYHHREWNEKKMLWDAHIRCERLIDATNGREHTWARATGRERVCFCIMSSGSVFRIRMPKPSYMLYGMSSPVCATLFTFTLYLSHSHARSHSAPALQMR